MTARAIRALDGPHGNFLAGDQIRDVPDDVVDAWIAAGVAVATTDDGTEAPRGKTAKPKAGLAAFKAAKERAVELGIDPKGRKLAELRELIARAAKVTSSSQPKKPKPPVDRDRRAVETATTRTPERAVTRGRDPGPPPGPPEG